MSYLVKACMSRRNSKLINRDRGDRGQGGWPSWSLPSLESLLWKRLEREPNLLGWLAKTKVFKSRKESQRLSTWK